MKNVTVQYHNQTVELFRNVNKVKFDCAANKLTACVTIFQGEKQTVIAVSDMNMFEVH